MLLGKDRIPCAVGSIGWPILGGNEGWLTRCAMRTQILANPDFRRIESLLYWGLLVQAKSERLSVLAGIKFLHTVIWLFFAGCIVAIPIAGARRQFLLAAVLTGLVLVECAVLAVNRCRCPLTNLAGRYTEERANSSDIYLPLWLARHNKTIFGTLFAVGELFVLGQWLISSR